MSTLQRIKKLRQQRDELLNALLEAKEMLRGTFVRTFRRCGKPNCWCATEEGHPSLRVTWTEQGQPRTKAIPSDDVGWVKTMTAAYRRFRKRRQQLRALDDKLRGQLDALENELVSKTKRQRDYFCR